MHITPAIVSAALLWAGAGCGGSVATQTDTNPALAAEMRQWRTYAWLPDATGGDPLVQNDIVRARVRAAADAELAALGYQRVTDNPDFLMGWNGAIDQRVDVEWAPGYYGYRWRRWYDDYEPVYVDEYSQGTLILDLVDANTNELAWRGVAEGRLGGYGPDLPSEGEIAEAVHEILEELPRAAR